MTPTPVGMRCPECSHDRTKVARIRSSTSEPTATYALIAINVGAFLVEVFTGGGLASLSSGGTLITTGGLNGPDVAYGHDYWRLVTSGFLHAGILHLLVNMYMLFVIGRLLEPAIGSTRFTIIYFVSLLCGSLGALLWDPLVMTVGASGAVFGLMGAAMVTLRARGMDPFSGGLGMILGLNLVITFILPGISIGGHVGGLIGGLLSAWLLIDVAARRSARVPATIACLLLGVAAVGASIAVADSSGKFFGLLG
ncbi:MAG: rhomboid family intramembrane serine protease [Solirubrobacterales bacterium]|nr:rhomboid family intramembrane serine protease [Solirubrobacterales bacterium]